MIGKMASGVGVEHLSRRGLCGLPRSSHLGLEVELIYGLSEKSSTGLGDTISQMHSSLSMTYMQSMIRFCLGVCLCLPRIRAICSSLRHRRNLPDTRIGG